MQVDDQNCKLVSTLKYQHRVINTGVLPPAVSQWYTFVTVAGMHVLTPLSI